jgi:SAM-dependent methyltransferase
MKNLLKKILPRSLLRFIKNLHLEIRGLYNARPYQGGNDVLCPCCGKSFKRFMDREADDSNDVNRYLYFNKNTICPYCGSLSRHRIVCYYFDEIKNKLPLSSHYGILMFGAERSIKKWFTRNGYRYMTADLFGYTANIKTDIQKTSFPDESWSLIICNHVLEHVPDYRAALKELRRILKSDGILELTVPTDRNFETVYEDAAAVTVKQRIDKFGQVDHLRIFGNDIQEILLNVGFSVEIIDGDKLPSIIRATIGPADYDDNKVYLCRRV